MEDIIQELIATQDSFKQAILSEPDAEKHIDIINSFSKKETLLYEKYEKKTMKTIRIMEMRD